MVQVSIVLPSRNEEEAIGACIQRIRKVFEENRIDGEIVVADNSEDRTPVIAEELGAEVVTPDGRGYGYAYRYAFRHLKAKHGGYPRYVILGDADDTYDFGEIPRLLEPLAKGETDLVIGSRFKGVIEEGAMPWLHRWVGNPVLTWFLDRFYGVEVSDAHSGFRGIRGEALDRLELRMDGMEFASEMIVEAARKGLRICEVPISYRRRRGGSPKLSSFRDGWRHMKFMLMFAPQYLFTYPGLSLGLAGILLTVFSLFHINIGYIPGVHSMIAGSLLTIIGYQVVFFGLFSNVLQRRQLPRFLTLDTGASIGLLVFLAGFLWAGKHVGDWIGCGFGVLPPVEGSIGCFTLVALGLQTFFNSFMLSIIAEHRQRWMLQAVQE